MKRALQFLLLLAATALCLPAMAQNKWQDRFDLSGCTMQSIGRNDYFILEPGFQLQLEGGGTRLQITVLDQTKDINGVQTRVVEEREWKKGELYEVSRNYFAQCRETGDVYYFGEDVDFYDKGKITKHDGSWLAGVNGARHGLIMPGRPKVKMRYYQEVAPKVAMDRAEIVSMSEVCDTPAGRFERCMKVRETSAIERLVSEDKYHAPGIGLVRDEDLRLVRHGVVKLPPQQ